jgi:hypothetical protein
VVRHWNGLVRKKKHSDFKMALKLVVMTAQKKLALFLLLNFFNISSIAQAVKENYPGVVVVELFTSQGDINSPAADKILSEVLADAEKNSKPVFCISEHVDFWNRFGWKDPFSSLKYTSRLQNYSTAFGDDETYTPRFIINGRPVTGNPDSKKIAETINKELNSKSLFVPEFSYVIFDDTLDLSFNLNADLKKNKSGSSYYLNFVVVEKGLFTKVLKGDNEGKSLRNDNVARFFYTTNLNEAKGLIRIPFKNIKKGPGKSFVLFIQDKKTKQIVGANGQVFN